jgi:Holliday junction resolvase RusA-like endonuclease
VWADESLLFHLWVDGEPVPWCVPKVARFGGEVPTPRRLAMKAWQQSIIDTWDYRQSMTTMIFEPLDGPLSCRLFFILPRPKARKKSEVWAETKADLDNLCKAVHDALQRCGVMTNDSRIVELHAAKAWTPHSGSNVMPSGVRIELRRPPATFEDTYVRNERSKTWGE